MIPISELIKQKSDPISLDSLAVNEITNFKINNGVNMVPWPQPSNGSVTTAASDFLS